MTKAADGGGGAPPPKLYRELADWWPLLSAPRLTAAGFEPAVVPVEHSELEPGTYETFACRKPAGAPSAGAASSTGEV